MRPNKLFLGILGASAIAVLAACQKQQTASSQSTAVSSIALSSSAKTETTATSRSSEQKEVKEMEPNFEAGALLAAANQRNLEQVREILKDSDYVIDEVDGENNTPLNIAVHNNDKEIAKLLIDRGADINKQNTISDSPYLYAGAQGRTEILAYMLTHGEPNLSVHNRFGGNALIPAAEKGHIENVKLLLADGREDIDFQNNYGYTALIEAVGLREGNELYQEIVRLLMDNGANQHIQDNSGRTAMDYAMQLGYTEISQILSMYD